MKENDYGILESQEEDGVSTPSLTPPLSPVSDKSVEDAGFSLDDTREDEMKAKQSSSLAIGPTIALCICVLTNSYLLISVFPYSGFMAIELLPFVNEENAGSYAGFLASSFMLGRTLTSFAWGKAADIYGRTTVLYISLSLSIVFILLFGTSQTFVSACLFRGLLGVSNGVIGTAKTLISELSHGNEALETRNMALIMGMWGWGFLVSPALSGALAEPVKQYPNAEWVQRHQHLLSTFPFLLPNLVGACLCFVSLIAVKLHIHETLPEERLQRPMDTMKRACLACRRRKQENDQEEVLPMKHVQIDIASSPPPAEQDDAEVPPRNEIQRARLEHGESCLMLSTSKQPLSMETTRQTQDDSNDDAPATMASLWSRPDTRVHLLVYWIFSFVSSCIEESFPLFCISKQGGLGLDEKNIGTILSGSGIIFALSQYCVYTIIVNRFGLHGSIKIGSIFFIPLILLIPGSRFLLQRHYNGDDDTRDHQVTWPVFTYLSIVMATMRVFGLVFFSSITVTTNRTVPLQHRATMNGLSMLGGSLVKGIGPAFAGFLAAFSFSSTLFSARFGGIVIFSTIGLFACIAAIPCVTGILERSSTYEQCRTKEDDDDSNHEQ